MQGLGLGSKGYIGSFKGLNVPFSRFVGSKPAIRDLPYGCFKRTYARFTGKWNLQKTIWLLEGVHGPCKATYASSNGPRGLFTDNLEMTNGPFKGIKGRGGSFHRIRGP